MEVSGEKAKQPGPKLKLVLERLKKGDALIVSDITRLCLTLYELMGILTVCMEKDVTVYCINDRYIFDDRMDRQLMINVFKQVDEIDHSLVSIRTKDALEQVKSTGKRLGRPKGSNPSCSSWMPIRGDHEHVGAGRIGRIDLRAFQRL